MRLLHVRASEITSRWNCQKRYKDILGGGAELAMQCHVTTGIRYHQHSVDPFRKIGIVSDDKKSNSIQKIGHRHVRFRNV